MGLPVLMKDREGLPLLPLCGVSASRASAAGLTVHQLGRCCVGVCTEHRGPWHCPSACCQIQLPQKLAERFETRTDSLAVKVQVGVWWLGFRVLGAVMQIAGGLSVA